MLCRTGAYLHATTVVGSSLALKYSLYLAELSAHFLHHCLCCTPYGSHCESAEEEGSHAADESTHENLRIHQVHLEVVHVVEHVGTLRVEDVACGVDKLLSLLNGAHHGNLYLLNIRGKQCQSRQCGTADGEALACGCRGVAESVESVGAVAHFLAQLAHLSVAASIVGYWTIGVGGKRDAEG